MGRGHLLQRSPWGGIAAASLPTAPTVHLTVAQVSMKFPALKEPKVSLLCSQALALEPYPVTEEFSPHSPVTSSHLRLGLPSGLFLSVSPSETECTRH
jgi:hypothetical protein